MLHFHKDSPMSPMSSNWDAGDLPLSLSEGPSFRCVVDA